MLIKLMKGLGCIDIHGLTIICHKFVSPSIKSSLQISYMMPMQLFVKSHNTNENCFTKPIYFSMEWSSLYFICYVTLCALADSKGYLLDEDGFDYVKLSFLRDIKVQQKSLRC